VVGAVRSDRSQVRFAAGRHQDGEAAGRKAEGADAVGVDAGVAGPGA
jgi:hypothetical protein